jgi:hypothetical protein
VGREDSARMAPSGFLSAVGNNRHHDPSRGANFAP